MNEAQVLDGVTSIVREVLDDESITLTTASRADEFPEWDSFKHISIVVGTETRFGVRFSTAEIESLKNVGDLVSLLSQKLAS